MSEFINMNPPYFEVWVVTGTPRHIENVKTRHEAVAKCTLYNRGMYGPGPNEYEYRYVDANDAAKHIPASQQESRDGLPRPCKYEYSDD